MVNDLVNDWRLRAKFVDDLTLLEVIPRNSPSVMCHIVSDVQEFASNNNMQLNPKKCKEMRVSFLHYNSCELQPIASGGIYIEEVTSFSYSGCTSLTISHGLSTAKYACVVFANLPKYLSHDLERVQKRALAIIFPFLPYASALAKAGIPTLEERRDVACAKFFKLQNGERAKSWISERRKSMQSLLEQIALLLFKTLKVMAPMYLQDLLQVKTRGRYSLRSDALGLHKVPHTCMAGKTSGGRAFTVAVPRFWDSLSLAIRESDSIDNFQRKLKTPTGREFVF
ncbi:uncharacterized protein [Montipora capricornis]|uniref:uncharacterized protein n=1 Tax=Montipora capricornis TaxID=246305 RepID=UPI0035F18BF6